MRTTSIIAAAMLIAASPLHAQIVADGATNTLSNATNTFTGDVIVGTNGSFTLLILSDNALLTTSNNGVIGLNATAKTNEVRLVSPTARWQAGSVLYLGSNGAFNRLVVSNGATVRDTVVGFVGYNASASNNLALVTGSGSTWNAGQVWLGVNGAGNQLVVSNGGAVLADYGYAGLNSSNNLALVTGSGSLWSNTLDLQVGNSSSGNQLVVNNGGTVKNGNGYVGVNVSSSNNLALVTGAGSVWSNGLDLNIGYFSASNQMIVSNGATVFAANDGFIGGATNANGNSVTVTDPGTSWINQAARNLYVGSNGAFNSLIVSNGATVQYQYLYAGLNASSSNNLIMISSSGSVRGFGLFELGSSGPGNQLVVSNGGLLLDHAGGYIGGTSTSSNNVALVTGFGSAWTNDDFIWGFAGSSNQLRVNNGGTLRNTSTSIGRGGVNNVALITDTGSLLTNGLDLILGEANGAFCSLVVSSGGSVIVGGNSFVSFNTSCSNNVAVVTGVGSYWNNATNVYIGHSGSGNLAVVTNGGLVSDFDGVLGEMVSSSNNTVLVTGTNSTWTNFADFVVGFFGNSNRVVVTNGGAIISDSGTIGGYGNGNQALVTSPGSQWSLSGDHLFVGYASNANQLVISNGGAVLDNIAYIGESFSSRSNFALVTGSGSVWSNADELYVGDFGSQNRLVVTNGGLVFAGSNIFVGQGVTSGSNRIVVDGGILLASNVLGTAALDVRRGTNVFNAGLINADQLLLTNTQGFFEFNGGTLITRGANGLGLTVGTSGTTPAIWDVRTGVSNHVLSGDLSVGANSSFNQLLVTNGALLTNFNFSLGTGGNSNVATISGAGSRFGAGGSISVGGGSFNRLVVTNGGSLFISGEAYVGSGLFGAVGNQALITGPGSVWNQLGQLYVGYFTGGHQLLVDNGGLVVSTNSFIGPFNNSSNNVALVTGAGSVWNTLDSLYVGNNGQRNQLQVTNGGLVTAANLVLVGVVNTSTNNSLLVDGGTLRVTNLTATGLFEIRRGTNVLNAGLIEADIVRMTNVGAGVLQFNGGTLSARSSKISSGTLLNIGNGASPATMILAGNGIHDFSGNLVTTISSNAALTGGGTLVGGISIAPGGTLIPGSSIGKMIFTNSPSLHGTVIMEISKNGANSTNDVIQAVTGTLTYGGSLIVSNLGPSALANGDKFRLFIATNYAGSFSSITLPSLPTGLSWVNKLLVDGSIEIFAPPAIPISSLSFAGGVQVYTQDFNSLAVSGSNPWLDNSTLLGWYAAKSTTPSPITNYSASDGSSSAGALYSFGSNSSPDRALGSIASDSIGSIAYGLCFSNDTGSSVSNFKISYTGEQWRDGGDFAVANTLTVWYRVSSSVLTNPEPGFVTNWTQVTNLSFVSPIVLNSGTGLNGNQASNQRAFSAGLISGLAVPPGQHVFFRWRDLNDSGGDQGMALDDLTVTMSVPTDRFWTNPLGGNYEVAANWLSNIVAQPLDTAHFTSNAIYQVNWGADALAANAFFDAASGTVTQAIGSSSWTLSTSYIVGKDSAATATVTHASGSLHVTNFQGIAVLKAGEAGAGTFNLAGGEVVTDILLVTNGSKSVFTFTGGTLRSRNTTVNNGSRLTVGTNTTAGTFELLGGSHSFANGLTIQSNSLLAGTGDISANVTVNGSISPGSAQGGVGQLNFNSGALNFSSTTTNLFEINKAAATNDTITCASIITLSGTLIVTNLGGMLTNSDRFQLFSGSFNFFGFQKLILPPLAAGLSWKNDTHKDGSIQVVQTPARDFGEDVSHFQGDISQSTWNQMFAEGKRFAFIKATEGLTGPNDLTMSNNVGRAMAAGLLAGVYHVAHPENRPTTNGAISEAGNFLAWAGSAIGLGRLRPVLDLEFGSGLTTSDLTDWVIAFSNEITNNRGAAAAPIIYTTESFAQNELDSRLANFDLWLAAYSGGSDPQADDPPPFGLSTNALGVFNNWSFWQYTDTGSSGGVSPLDLDVCHSEYKPLSAYLIPGLPPPTPIQLSGTAMSSNGAVQFSFTNTPGAFFAVLAATNPSLPLSNWTVLGPVTEIAPGQFQFIDLQATNQPQRFYRVRSP